MVFGAKASQDLFDDAMSRIFGDIPQCLNQRDDILIGARDWKEHNETLGSVSQRAEDYGITFNKPECHFGQTQITFYGYRFDLEGLKPTPEKVQAIHECEPPGSKTEVRSFLGNDQLPFQVHIPVSITHENVGEVTRLAEFARSQPQASYAAFTFGLSHRWTYFMRTLPDIENLLQPLQRAISDVLIPSLIARNCPEAERNLAALPVRTGGLGLINPSDSADAEYSASIRVSALLASKIEAQSHETPEEAEVQRMVHATPKEKDDGLKKELEEVKAMLPDKTQRTVDLACEKGASNWLTVIPLEDMDFDLNKREFRDAVRLRYDWPIPDNPSVCVCRSMFTVNHAMICQRGGLVIQRHNEIRDLEAELLDMVCYKQAKSLPEGLTKPLMHALTSTVEVSGSDRGLHFSI